MPQEILLVQLPPWDARTAPLGIAYLAANLNSKGIRARVFDLNIYMHNLPGRQGERGWGNDDFFWWQSRHLDENYSLSFDGFAEKILSFGSRVIGFSATIPSLPLLNRLCRRIKKKSARSLIIVGGPAIFFSQVRRAALSKCPADYLVIGEGEEALYQLLRAIGKKTRPAIKNSGLSVWREHIFSRTACIRQKNPQDLDGLAPPAFTEFDLVQYSEGSNSRDFTLPIIFSKGCIRHCTFCSDRVLSYPFRSRRPENIVNEIKGHLVRYPDLKALRVNDLSLNADLKLMEELCDRLIAAGIRIKWYGQAQVRPDMGVKLLSKMKQAGCCQLDLGVENFSDRVLTMMRKGYDSKEAVSFLKAVKDAGISTNVLLIVGYPGETGEDFQNNLESIRKNAGLIDRVGSLNICGMPVGSELRQYPRQHKVLFPLDIEWVTDDYANTYETRKARYNRMAARCRESGIPVDCCLDLDTFERSAKENRW